MFGSEMLEVGIGIVFVFLLVSVLCSAIREAIEARLKTRAAYLERGIRELLHDRGAAQGGLARAFFTHPLIASLYSASEYAPATTGTDLPLLAKGSDLPSYIPSRNFALALLDIAARGPTTDAVSSDPASPVISLESVRANVLNIQNPAVQRVLLTALDTAKNDIDRAQQSIEAWYDSGMDRVSGWYKRSTQWVLFWIGLAVAILLNVDAIAIANYLYDNDAARQVIVAQAEKVARDSTILHANYAEARGALDSLALPIGWRIPAAVSDTTKPMSDRIGAWVSSTTRAAIPALPGWLITALATTLGAPFWFDLLNKFMVVRSTVKPHEKSPEESSEDRQTSKDKKETASPPAAPTGAIVTPAGVQLPPPPPEPIEPRTLVAAPRDATSAKDGCDVDMAAAITDDEHLPPAEGGVA